MIFYWKEHFKRTFNIYAERHEIRCNFRIGLLDFIYQVLTIVTAADIFSFYSCVI